MHFMFDNTLTLAEMCWKVQILFICLFACLLFVVVVVVVVRLLLGGLLFCCCCFVFNIWLFCCLFVVFVCFPAVMREVQAQMICYSMDIIAFYKSSSSSTTR